MGSEHLGRRQVLTAAGAGLVAAAGLGGTAAAASTRSRSSDDRDDDSIAGGWLITRTDTGSSTHVRAVVTFADGGAALAVDIDPGAPPLAGAWEAEGGDSFKVTFWGTATDDSGNSVGVVRVRVSGHSDGHRISGTYRVRAFVQGQTQTGTGSFHGTRIDAD